MLIAWSTEASAESVVQYGTYPENFTLTVTGVTWEFEGECMGQGKRYMHRVVVTGLEPGTRFSYRVGSERSWSPPFFFDTQPSIQTGPNTFYMLADMGKSDGSATLKSMYRHIDSAREPVAVIHAGDIAYDLHSNEGKTGDDFMKMIEPIVAYKPYMTSPGNHEGSAAGVCGYDHYRNRFSMPYPELDDGLKWQFWYSYNVGLVHFISLDTDHMIAILRKHHDDPRDVIEKQIAFIEEDLRRANTAEARAEQPWIVVYGHHPLYCSNLSEDDCFFEDSVVRTHLDPLLTKYKVDIYFSGHQHSYERLWPVSNGTVVQESYNNPKAPVHIVSGQNGCNENYGVCLNVVLGARGPWSAFRSWLPGFYGYSTMTVHNATHIRWQQVLAYFYNLPQDEIWIVKDQNVRTSS